MLVPVIILVGTLVVFHTMLVRKNTTTYEHVWLFIINLIATKYSLSDFRSENNLPILITPTTMVACSIFWRNVAPLAIPRIFLFYSIWSDSLNTFIFRNIPYLIVDKSEDKKEREAYPPISAWPVPGNKEAFIELQSWYPIDIHFFLVKYV